MSDRRISTSDGESISRLTHLVGLLTEQIDTDHRSTAKRAYRAARAQCWYDLADRTPDEDPLGKASKLAFQQLAAQDSVVDTAHSFPQSERFTAFESSYASRNNDHPHHGGELPSEDL